MPPAPTYGQDGFDFICYYCLGPTRQKSYTDEEGRVYPSCCGKDECIDQWTYLRPWLR
jgi:hypothetical protein